MSDALQTAISFHEALQAYHQAFSEHFDNQVTTLPTDRFWQLQTVFNRQVIRFRFGYGRTNGVEQAAREFFRQPYAGDFRATGPGTKYSFDEAMSFAKSWRDIAGQLYEPLFDVVTGRGDDGYSDLLDSLPLAGREVVNKATNREFDNNQQFEEAVVLACSKQGYEQLTRLILRGENYIGMSLFDSAKDYLVYQAVDSVSASTA